MADQSVFDSSIVFDPSTDTAPASSLDINVSPFGSSLDAIAPGVTQTIADTQQPGESWMSTLQRLLPTLASTYQQSQLLQVQVDRAKAGLPPLDVSQYAAGVNVGLSPDTQKFLLIGGGLLVGLFALSALSRR